MKNKQTSVEFLQEALSIHLTFEQQIQFEGLFQQAKEMEKQQIMNAVYDSMGTNLDPNMGRAEQYYNETYGKGGAK